MPNTNSLVTCEWESSERCADQAIAWVQFPNEDGAGIGLMLCQAHLDEHMAGNEMMAVGGGDRVEVRLLSEEPCDCGCHYSAETKGTGIHQIWADDDTAAAWCCNCWESQSK